MKWSSSKPIDMGTGSVPSIILALAIPSMISMFFQNLYAFIDTIFISWLGTVPLAAQALSVPLFYIALSLGKGVQVGTATLISHARGRGEPDKIRPLVNAALPMLLLAIAPLFLLLIPPVCNTVFGWVGAEGELLQDVYRYALWLIMGFPVMAYVMICEAVFMSHGDTLTPMKSMLLGNFVNLLMAPLLMFVVGWGIAGASLATLIGQIFSAVYIRSKIKQAGLYAPSIKWRTGTLQHWKRIGKLGFFVAITFFISPVSLSLLNGVLASFGPEAVGAWNIMSRIEMMGMLPLNGMATAMIPFMSFNYGQHQYDRIRQGIKFFLMTATLFILPIMIIFIAFPDYLMLPFRAKAQVAELGAHAIRIAAMGYILMPVELALFGSAQGLQKPGYPLFAMGMRILVFRYPLAIGFAAWQGIYAVYWCQPVSVALSSVIAAWLLWRLIKKISSRPGLQAPVNVIPAPGDNPGS